MSTPAHEIRNLIQLVESEHAPATAPVQEAFPVLKQAIKAKLAGVAGKFSSRMKGHALIQKALVPYMNMFARHMGIRGKNWDTVTWKDVLNFVASRASLSLPLEEFEPQQLTALEIKRVIADPSQRAIVAQYLGPMRNQLPKLMPQNISSVWNTKVGGNSANAADISQRLITGLFTVMIRAQLEKAHNTDDFGAQPDQAAAPTPTAATARTPTPVAVPTNLPQMNTQDLARWWMNLAPEMQNYLKSLPTSKSGT